MKNPSRKTIWISGSALALLITVAGVAFARNDAEDKDEADVALPTATFVRAVESAGRAKPGNIAKAEAEQENGKTIVSVEIQAKDGKTFEVNVEAASGKVLNIEDAEKDEEKDGEEKDGEEGEGK